MLKNMFVFELMLLFLKVSILRVYWVHDNLV